MRTITVKGVGKVSVRPNLIVISMRLETENEEYGKAMSLASEKIENLNNALEGVGFEKQSVKTTAFNVRTNYESVRDEKGNYRSVFKGYVCSHNLKVEFDFDTKTLAKVLSAISSCLAMPELSISFTVKDPSEVSNELLKSATLNAKEKAEILCSSFGVNLGELVSIDYNWNDINVFSATDYKIENRCMLKAEACLSNIEIEPDDICVNDSATFVWEIYK